MSLCMVWYMPPRSLLMFKIHFIHGRWNRQRMIEMEIDCQRLCKPTGCPTIEFSLCFCYFDGFYSSYLQKLG